jgi:holliday junction DNA helicase RuvA
MIVRLSGTVLGVEEGYAVIDHDGIGYEVMICGHSRADLEEAMGRPIVLHTLQYLEGSAAGGNMVPRLVGFLRMEDKLFFERFITVKGMGVRKAVKSLQEPTSSVAVAIESGDAKYLTKLPGIGKRAADQIIAELKGKVTDFAVGAVPQQKAEVPTKAGWTQEQHDALAVLLALGERPVEAERWMEKARDLYPDTKGVDQWLQAAYRASGRE